MGRRLEHPSVIKDLLDVELVPAKPQYPIADEKPLILYNSDFEGLRWVRRANSYSRSFQVLKEHLERHLVAAAMCGEVLEALQPLLPAHARRHRAALMARPQAGGLEREAGGGGQPSLLQPGEQQQLEEDEDEEDHHMQLNGSSGADAAAARLNGAAPPPQPGAEAAAAAAAGAAATVQLSAEEEAERSAQIAANQAAHHHIPLTSPARAVEHSLEQRFEKAGISLELLNKPGLLGFEGE